MLLYILEKESIITSIRASFSSTRWRHFPAGLPHINLNVSDFLPPSKISSVNDREIDGAMLAMTKAARICLAAHGRGSITKTISLRLCLTSNYLHDIGELVGKAIGNNKVKTVELVLPTNEASHCDMTDMVQHANSLICFFDTFPNLLRCLTRLVLYKARFSKLEMCRLLDNCEQLQQLELNKCDTGDLSTLKINVPNSKISHLRLFSCCFEKIEFLCLPKLAILYCETWITSNAPLSFGYVPCLEELSLVCSAKRDQLLDSV
ncbi:hypothetical protein PR202_gb18950 [Eleusine coracana subsp. coracana]|uniref:Uncharacterized protein n=1 Tax=Eleusine coracana subsp. coracana TaxID=191504 RepID=A0AAV5F4Q6_ELECO|nr:hypothetical protein PR202_gb18950 [Eleusine coracana subsp. coracana]